MVRTIKQTVTVGEGGRIEIPESELPAGTVAEVIVVLAEATANGVPIPMTRPPKVSMDQFKLPEEADAYLQALQKEWEGDEERSKPISVYYGTVKSSFKDCDEVDAFIRAERDSWEE